MKKLTRPTTPIWPLDIVYLDARRNRSNPTQKLVHLIYCKIWHWTSQNVGLNGLSLAHPSSLVSHLCFKTTILWQNSTYRDSGQHRGKPKHGVPEDKVDWSSRWRNPATQSGTTGKLMTQISVPCWKDRFQRLPLDSSSWYQSSMAM